MKAVRNQQLTTSNQQLATSNLFSDQHGLRVPELIASTKGSPVESVNLSGIIYTAYAYISMPITARNQVDWRDAAMPPRLGNVMGQMHRLARS